jgi:uncharacterized protein
VEPEASAGALPVQAGERVVLLDVLRGFALGGVFISNAKVWFSGQVFLPRPRLDALNASPVNTAFDYLYRFFVAGKLVTIFSFLFGLGFAVQMMRAEERGAPVVSTHVRRLLILLTLGLAHMFFLWYGDILGLYALLGLLLLLFRRRSDRALLAWGFTLVLAAPLIVPTLDKFLPLWLTSQEAALAATKVATDKSTAIKAETLAAFESGSYFTAMHGNFIFLEDFLFKISFVTFSAITVGKFLLGFYAGRRRLFHEPEKHLGLFRRLLWWSLAAGVLGNGFFVVLRYLRRSHLVSEDQSWSFLFSFITQIGDLGMGIFYVAAMTLLFQRPLGKRLLSTLAPAGRMALTNYLTQSAIALLLFYGIGLGLITKIGTAPTLGLTAGLFTVQMLVSHLWLSRLQFGPVEWLWRSLTYGRAQPMRPSGANTRPSPAPAPRAASSSSPPQGSPG